MTSKTELSYTIADQVILINALEKDELANYMKLLIHAYKDSDRSAPDLKDIYNYEFFSKIQRDSYRLIICTALISYVRANGFDPCSLWVSIYSSGGHLLRKPKQ